MDALASIVLPVISLILIGYFVGRLGIFGSTGVDALAGVTFTVFMPPLLFRSMAKVDLAGLSPSLVVAYFGPVMLMLSLVIGIQAYRGVGLTLAAIRGICATFSNSALLGVPIVQLAFGEQGLAILLILIALHALLLISVATLVIEFDANSRKDGGKGSSKGAGGVMLETLKSSVLHPVVLPILLGLGWGLTGAELPEVVDRTLAFLGQAGPPASLVLLGASLVAHNARDSLKASILLCAVKLILLPFVVYCSARWLFNLQGTALAVVTLMAGLPTGKNAFLLSQRYGVGVGEATTTISLSTILAIVTLSLILSLL